jgi:hypothetical protein
MAIDAQPPKSLPLAIGEAAAKVETGAIRLATRRVYEFRTRHPWVYGLTAFILGGGFIGVFTMTTYTNWAFEGIDLKTAVYQVVFGSLGGGIAAVVLAFAYARTVRETII